MKTAAIRQSWIRVTASLALVVSACSDESSSAVLANTPREPAKIGAWGFDVEGMDRAAAPGSSFYAHANGGWLASHEIPADRVAWGSFNELAASTEEQLRGLLEGLPSDAPAGTPAQQVNDYYRSYGVSFSSKPASAASRSSSSPSSMRSRRWGCGSARCRSRAGSRT